MFSVDLEDSAASRFLDGIHDRLNRPEHLLDALVDEVHKYERDLFDSAGDGAWPALSEKTVQLKGSSRILVDSGDLLDQLTTASDISGDDAEVVARTAYARFHKYGTGRMPRRDPAPEPSSAKVGEWAEVLLDTIVDGHR